MDIIIMQLLDNNLILVTKAEGTLFVNDNYTDQFKSLVHKISL